MKRDKNLLDLPIAIYDRDMCCGGGSKILDSFLEDLHAITSVDELSTFLTKWHNIWLLRHPLDESLNELCSEEQKLLAGDFDREEVLLWLRRKKELADDIPYEENEAVRIMAHIVMPIPTLWAFMLAQHYGVNSDLGFVRFFLDPYPEHDKSCRYGSGDCRPK